MAEVLGVIASGVSIGSIAIQIVGSVQQILDFWSSIKDAPTDIQDLLEELQILANLLSEVDSSQNNGPNSLRQLAAAKYCKNAATSINDVVKDLADGFAMSKGRRRWTAVIAVLKEKKMAKSLQRLERAKMMLFLAQQCYTQAQIEAGNEYHRQRLQTIEDMLNQSANQGTVAATAQRNTSTLISSIGRAFGIRSGRTVPYDQTTGATYWSPFGSVVVRSMIAGKGSAETEEESVEHVDIRFHPAWWICQQGYRVLSTKLYGRWQYSFRSYRIITLDDPVYRACASGDLETVKRLCGQGRATPFDTGSAGWSLLHIAAAIANPALCRWLINQGLDGNIFGDMEMVFTGREATAPFYWQDTTPLMVAASCSGREVKFFTGDETDRNSWDNWNRPADVLETLRVLIELAQSDPMISGPDCRSALYDFTGRVEHFNYLLRQEHFQIDLSKQRDQSFSVAEIHSHQCFASSPDISLLAHEYESAMLEKTVRSRNSQELALARTPSSVLLHGVAWQIMSHCLQGKFGASYLAGVVNLVKKLVANGVDVHGFTKSYFPFEGRNLTPLDIMLTRVVPYKRAQSRASLNKEAILRLKKWLRVLKDAGVNLKKYLREEERLATARRENGLWFHPRRPRRYQYRMDWHMELDENDDISSISGEYVFRKDTEQEDEEEEEEEKTRIPGSWIEEE